MPADSASETDLLLTDYSGDSDADAEGTAFGTAMNECVAPVSNNTSAIWESTRNIPTIMPGVS